MIAPYGHVLVLAGMTFVLGLICILVRRDLIMILIGVEIMMNAGAIAFVGASLKWHLLDGQIFVLFLFGVAAAEVAVGLALLVRGHRESDSLDSETFNLLKW
jgi:NADH-quinone oxidoreductase subunit K